MDASLGDAHGETGGAPDGGSGREVVGFEFGVGRSQRDLALWVHRLSPQHGWSRVSRARSCSAGIAGGKADEDGDTRRGDDGGD